MRITDCRLISSQTARVLLAFFCAISVSQSQSKQSKIGAFGSPNWLLDQNGNNAWDGTPADGLYPFFYSGQSGDIQVHGDWNGDGTTKIGVYANGAWYLDYNGNGVWDGPNVDKVAYFGGQDYTPVVGDWNGSGTTKIGAVYKDGTWTLDYNGNFDWDGPGVDRQVLFGGTGYTFVVGDWNGSGSTKLGAYKDGIWYLDYNGNLAWDGASVDKLLFFGGPSYIPMVGDWNGSGTQKIGAFLNGLWLLDFNGSFAWEGDGIDRITFFGADGWTPMAGDWNGSGTAKVGAYLNGGWVLDVSGNYLWDPLTDLVPSLFGGPGQTPVVGAWPNLAISFLSPAAGPVGTAVTIAGNNFGTSQGSSTVTFNGVNAGTASSWSATRITVAVPVGAATGNVVVTVNGLASAGKSFTVPAVVSSISPSSGAAGLSVIFSGSRFGPTQGTSAVWLGSTRGTIVSWTDTQVVALVASNSTSGTAQLQQGGVWTPAVSFNVTTVAVSNVSPLSGVPGTQVTIAGSGFGAVQGTGQVWLGTANGVVQSWSNIQIGALVAVGSTTGVAQVLQGGVWSTPVTFTVSTPHIATVSPSSGVPGTPVTITGTGFGSSQGTGAVVLGSISGQVVSWSDTQVVANVAVGSATGIARIQQNGAWSNALSFVVPGSGGSAAKLSPNLLNMVVGDTRAIQALNTAGQPVTGLAWTSSNPAVVSVSTTDPRVLSALTVGHITITAGGASSDVIVSAGPLPLGTVLWSNPGNVSSIVPAVPSSSGVADVFASQSDGTIQAITSDGTVAWTANPGLACQTLPDFQGGLVLLLCNSNIVKLDGLTGQAYPPYTGGQGNAIAVHTDGTIITTTRTLGPPYTVSVIGIDPITGTQKFSVTAVLGAGGELRSGLMIAGDGYAYIPYASINYGCAGCNAEINHLKLLRVNSAGASDVIGIKDWTTTVYDRVPVSVGMITNADTGVFLSIKADGFYTATTNGASVSVVSAQPFPGQDSAYIPYLQAQDGSFVGTLSGNMVAFDASGNLRWSVPNEIPQIATDDGGVIGQSGIKYDQSGSATGQGNLNASQSPGWLGNILGTAYAANSGVISSVSSPSTKYATTFAALLGGNASGQGTAIQQVMTKLAQTGAKQLPSLGSFSSCYPLLFSIQPLFKPTCGNINAIELITNNTPDSIFQNYLQTFVGATRQGPASLSPNSVMTFTGQGNTNTINVTGPGQTLTISLKGFEGIFQAPFQVLTERFDPAAHTVSVVTLAGHPLAGWRYWRVYSIGTNDVVIETGAYDQPAPGPLNYAGYYIAKGTVSKGWKDYLLYIRDKLIATQGSNLQNTLGGITLRNYQWLDGSLLNGYWDYFGDFTQYILNNVCQSTSCN